MIYELRTYTVKPGTIGSNPAFTAGFPVAEIIAIDRPWNDLFIETTFQRLGDIVPPRSRARSFFACCWRFWST